MPKCVKGIPPLFLLTSLSKLISYSNTVSGSPPILTGQF